MMIRISRPTRVTARWSVVLGLIAAAGPAAAQTGLATGPHEIVVNGVRLWYRVAGNPASGLPPVVFLHGGPGQGSHHFAALAGPQLEPTLRLVYFDQRGSGRSERPWTGEYGLSTLLDDIEGLRRELGVPRIVVMGHSYGAVLALEYAARHPTRVAAAVIVAGLWDAPMQGRLRCEKIFERFPALARTALGDSTAAVAARGDCDWFWALPEPQRETVNAALMFPDSVVRARLDSTEAASGLRNTRELSAAVFRAGLPSYRFGAAARITAPVLVVSGRHDGAVVSEGLRALARELSNARFREFERSGHFVYLDEPARFAREVTAFLRDVLPRRARK